MSRRYLFLCPDRKSASGGVAVIHDCVVALRQTGRDAALLYTVSDGRAPGAAEDLRAYYDLSVPMVQARKQPLPKRLLQEVDLRAGVLRNGGNRRLELSSEDVLIVPEFMLSAAQAAYPGHAKIVLVQNSFAYLREVGLLLNSGQDPHAGIVLTLAISDSCMDAVSLVGADPVARMPVGANFSLFQFRAEKSKRIAYMPRKRRAEAAVLDSALRRRGRLQGFELVAIDNVSQAEVAATVCDSLVFMSLMKSEALGFPAMEAMAAGCVVVGYTGLGTREYFDTETGVPVAEDDSLALVTAVEETVASYVRDPAPFDTMRKRASERVRARYNFDVFRDALLEAFLRIDASLTS